MTTQEKYIEKLEEYISYSENLYLLEDWILGVTLKKELSQLKADIQEEQSQSDEDVATPIQDALYATGHFTATQCSLLTNGILDYIKDAGMKIVAVEEQSQRLSAMEKEVLSRIAMEEGGQSLSAEDVLSKHVSRINPDGSDFFTYEDILQAMHQFANQRDWEKIDDDFTDFCLSHECIAPSEYFNWFKNNL